MFAEARRGESNALRQDLQALWATTPGYWELKLGLSEKQWVLLTTEPVHQPKNLKKRIGELHHILPNHGEEEPKMSFLILPLDFLVWHPVIMEDGSFVFEFYTESLTILYRYHQPGYMLINNLQFQ